MSLVTSISLMFYNCSSFNQPLNSWNTSSMTNFSYAFSGCTIYNQPLNNWDTSLVGSMLRMFRKSSAFDQDISSWSLSSLTTADLFKDDTVGFSTVNYDAILIAWEAQTLNTGVSFHFGASKYSSGAAATARASLVSNYSWTITDGGAV